MFLVLVDGKVAGDHDCKSLKYSKSVCTDIFGILYCIAYILMSGPSLLIESTDSMIQRWDYYYDGYWPLPRLQTSCAHGQKPCGLQLAQLIGMACHCPRCKQPPPQAVCCCYTWSPLCLFYVLYKYCNVNFISVHSLWCSTTKSGGLCVARGQGGPDMATTRNHLFFHGQSRGTKCSVVAILWGPLLGGTSLSMTN